MELTMLIKRAIFITEDTSRRLSKPGLCNYPFGHVFVSQKMISDYRKPHVIFFNTM